MADDPKRERRPAPEPPAPERPVAEPQPLTVTVLQPTATPAPAAPAPPTTVVPRPPLIQRIPAPRWYWALVGLAAAFVYMDYHYVWSARIQKFMEHRVLPARVVRIEHSIWRHTFGAPKEAAPHSGTGPLRVEPSASAAPARRSTLPRVS